MSPPGPRSAARLRWYRPAAALLLSLFLIDRLLLIFGQPDLLHDLDPGELKHMGVYLEGFPGGEDWKDRLRIWLSGPENIHHGGFPTVSLLFLLLSKVFGGSLETLRLIPMSAALGACILLAGWLRRRSGDISALLALALLTGAPLLFLKWTAIARGGHTEAVIFPPLMLVLLTAALERSKEGLRAWPMWTAAGICGGFAVYVSYLCIPFVIVLSLGALAELALSNWRRGLLATLLLVLSGLAGFGPWLFGYFVLEMPYFAASIHASSNPDESIEVMRRGLVGMFRGASAGLPHNLWPWTYQEVTSPVYRTNPSDLLPYTPNTMDWIGRALITASMSLAFIASWVKRSPLIAALTMLPGVHYLFVMRLANPGAWPDIPHRYLVIVFPMAMGAAALGAGWAVRSEWRPARIAGSGLAAALMILALISGSSHLRWVQMPQPDLLSHWNTAKYRFHNFGQVRLEEAPKITPLISFNEQDSVHPMVHAKLRGLALVYPAISEYYLLWRPSHKRVAPYPDYLFSQHDPLTPPEELPAVALGAFEATLARAGDDHELRDAWLCSWDPGPQYEAVIQELFAERIPQLRCN